MKMAIKDFANLNVQIFFLIYITTPFIILVMIYNYFSAAICPSKQCFSSSQEKIVPESEEIAEEVVIDTFINERAYRLDQYNRDAKDKRYALEWAGCPKTKQMKKEVAPVTNCIIAFARTEDYRMNMRHKLSLKAMVSRVVSDNIESVVPEISVRWEKTVQVRTIICSAQQS